MNKHSLNDFLSGIRPYVEGSDLSSFILELEKIPNCEMVFQELLRLDPYWHKTANDTGVYFFLCEVDKTKYPYESHDNQLNLRVFSNGTCPIIEVVTFV